MFAAAVLLGAMSIRPAAAQDGGGVGAVRGVVQTQDGKPVGGFWLMIVNPELGMNYRKDVNPIGEFEYTGVYPGTYVFRISPYSYTVVSPPQIQVQANRSMDVKVIVSRAPAERGSAPPNKDPLRVLAVGQGTAQ